MGFFSNLFGGGNISLDENIPIESVTVDRQKRLLQQGKGKENTNPGNQAKKKKGWGRNNKKKQQNKRSKQKDTPQPAPKLSLFLQQIDPQGDGEDNSLNHTVDTGSLTASITTNSISKSGSTSRPQTPVYVRPLTAPGNTRPSSAAGLSPPPLHESFPINNVSENKSSNSFPEAVENVKPLPVPQESLSKKDPVDYRTDHTASLESSDASGSDSDSADEEKENVDVRIVIPRDRTTEDASITEQHSYVGSEGAAGSYEESTANDDFGLMFDDSSLTDVAELLSPSSIELDLETIEQDNLSAANSDHALENFSITSDSANEDLQAQLYLDIDNGELQFPVQMVFDCDFFTQNSQEVIQELQASEKLESDLQKSFEEIVNEVEETITNAQLAAQQKDPSEDQWIPNGLLSTLQDDSSHSSSQNSQNSSFSFTSDDFKEEEFEEFEEEINVPLQSSFRGGITTIIEEKEDDITKDSASIDDSLEEDECQLRLDQIKKLRLAVSQMMAKPPRSPTSTISDNSKSELSDRLPSIGPSATELPATEPSATEPSATEPSAIEPSAIEPSATVPSATVPSTTEPSATEPSIITPSTTVPSTTVPSAPVPSAPVPSVTTSAVPVPSAVEPSAVEPSAIEPSAVEPSAVEPSAVEPSVTTSAALVPSVTTSSDPVPSATIPPTILASATAPDISDTTLPLSLDRSIHRTTGSLPLNKNTCLRKSALLSRCLPRPELKKTVSWKDETDVHIYLPKAAQELQKARDLVATYGKIMAALNAKRPQSVESNANEGGSITSVSDADLSERSDSSLSSIESLLSALSQASSTSSGSVKIVIDQIKMETEKIVSESLNTVEETEQARSQILENKWTETTSISESSIESLLSALSQASTNSGESMTMVVQKLKNEAERRVVLSAQVEKEMKEALAKKAEKRSYDDDTSASSSSFSSHAQSDISKASSTGTSASVKELMKQLKSERSKQANVFQSQKDMFSLLHDDNQKEEARGHIMNNHWVDPIDCGSSSSLSSLLSASPCSSTSTSESSESVQRMMKTLRDEKDRHYQRRERIRGIKEFVESACCIRTTTSFSITKTNDNYWGDY